MPFAAQHIRDARNQIRKQDLVMRDVIKQVGPFTQKTKRDRFAALACSICSQQISTKAAASIWQRLNDLIKGGVSAESIDGFDLPQLRTAGVSQQKGTYLKDLATKVLAGDVDLSQLGRKKDEEVIEVLTQVKGIGRWTAQMFLMFTLGRLDVLPTDDLGIRSAMRKAYELEDLPDAQAMNDIAEPWRPYATVGCWYLWQWLDSPKSDA